QNCSAAERARARRLRSAPLPPHPTSSRSRSSSACTSICSVAGAGISKSVKRRGYGAVSGRMRLVIGISLLTLVPGVVGGSETYARELCRALGRVGEQEYRVFLPSIAEDAADG